MTPCTTEAYSTMQRQTAETGFARDLFIWADEYR